TLVAEDLAGHTTEATRSVTYDGTAPELSITDPTPGTTTPEATYTVRGTAEDPHLDRVVVEGRTATLSGASWSVDLPLVDGENAFAARAFDRAGQSTAVSFSIFRDSDAPSIQITVPADGASVRSEEIEVRGAVENVDGTTVTVNGRAAFIDQGIFFVTVPLSVGENVLTARATDAQGNEGVHTRTVIRDETSPSYVVSEPAEGALAVPLGSAFRLEFSEPMAEPVDGALALRAGSQDVGFSVGRDGAALVITPDAALPPASAVTVTLTALLTDVAGNPLSPVPSALTFTTDDTSAPPAPVISPPPPAFLCAPSVTLLGTATTGAFVEAAGGAGQVRARVEADGTFILGVDLVPDRLNRLDVTALANDGDRSAATTLEVVQDCRGPSVAEAILDGTTLTLTFSESIDPSSLAGAVTLTDATGAIGLAGSATDAVASLTLAWAASGAAALDVSTAIVDLAGNALAFPYVEVFDQAAGDSFFSGLVLDASTGRPLEGAVVTVTATGGVASADPPPTSTTSVDGRALLTVPAGTHDVTFARDGFVPVFRIVTTQSGEGTQVFDPRLQPASDASTVPTSGG
ncbi:MAG: Ig-like domain-containing protein, partial [Acidobacteriota bacterium]